MIDKINIKLSEYEKEILKNFIKTGIIVLSILALIGFGIKYIPKVVTVINTSDSRKLQVYSVDEEENETKL